MLHQPQIHCTCGSDTVWYYSDDDIGALYTIQDYDLLELLGWNCFNKLKVKADKTKAMFIKVRPRG